MMSCAAIAWSCWWHRNQLRWSRLALDDIFKIGTVSRVARMIRMPDGTIQIIVQGLERVAIGEFTQEKPYLVAHVTLKPDTQEDG